MKFLILVFLLALSFISFCPAQTETKTVNRDTALKAIEIFCADPLSQDGKSAAAIVLNFSEKSPDVEISLDPKPVPWIREEPQPQYAAILLSAYIVGNTKSQLDSGKTKNDPVAGVLQAIATYRQIQKLEPGFKMAEVEKLIDLDKQNKLKEYLEAP